MINTKSLRFKLLISFIAVMIPLAIGIMYLNYYAMKVVRDEVSHSTSNLLSLHVSQIDNNLEKISQYLLRLSTSDAYYYDLVGLTLFEHESSNYFFAKQRIFNHLQEELTAYEMVDTFFAYSATYDELISTERSFQSSIKNSEMLHNFIVKEELNSSPSWQVVRHEEENYLLRIEQIHPNVYVGALVKADTLMIPLQPVDLGPSGKAMLLSIHAEPLSETQLDSDSLRTIVNKLARDSEGYDIFTDPTDQTSYLLVGSRFVWAPVTLAVIIPENDLLQKLPYFQRGLVLVPAGIVILLIIFSFVFKQVLHEPMNALIRGMRRMSQGDFNVRLEDGKSSEFTFLNETFNNMVTQIRTLKINVYEEMLKTQEAEFRHLQAQINPHFYLNSLNIVYSLSLLKKNDLVEKMTMHLAEYFRFIMGASREFILLEQETEHIRNYLEIQRLRFPTKLEYDIVLPERYKDCQVFPLMIQPFVENAIKHGMNKGKEIFRISIVIRETASNPKKYEIVIADNGKGFPAETLQRLNDGVPVDPSPVKSLGIRNVQNRLRLKFGDAVSISFQNRVDECGNGAIQGAEVILRIPLNWDEEGEITDE